VNAFGHVLFNVLANSIVSFVLTLAVVYGALRLFRFGPGRCRLWLLLLPFAKVLQELISGVPESSFLWAKLAGRTQDLGTFRIGFGVEGVVPLLRFELGAFSGGLIYPQSLADVLDAGLTKHLGNGLTGVLAASVALISAWRLALLWRSSRVFLNAVFREARVVESCAVGRRTVEVFVSRHYLGVPFATGILHPCVVFSARTYATLTNVERDAALQHELAHIAHYDLVLLAGLRVLESLFWYLPGARGLVSRIHGVLEQRADDSALSAGAQPIALAAALVHAGEIVRGPVPGAAILSSRSLLALRVQRLLRGSPDHPRPRRLIELVRLAIAVLVTITIAQALFLGNHAAALVRFAVP
jgi:hypothetical protein